MNVSFYDLLILIAVSVGCAMLGGALLYIFVTYGFKELILKAAAGDLSFLKNPGIVFYGGLLGGIAGCVVASELLKVRIEAVEACIVPFIPLGHAVGRVGCLMAGCCYGLPYNGMFAVTSRFAASDTKYFPIQGAEALFDLMIAACLLNYTKRTRDKYAVLSLYLCMYSALRFVLEFFRGDIVRGHFLFFSTSQWLSLIIFFFSFVLGKRAREKSI